MILCAVTYDYMIQQFYPDNIPSFFQSFSNQYIGPRGFNVSGRVIVNDKNTCHSFQNGKTESFPWMYNAFAKASKRNQFNVLYYFFHIHTEYPKMFLLLVKF